MADLQLILIDIMTICFAILNAFPQQTKTWEITNLMTCLVHSHHDSASLMVDDIRIGKADIVLILVNYASMGWNICLLFMVVKYSKSHQKYLRFWYINFDHWDDWEDSFSKLIEQSHLWFHLGQLVWIFTGRVKITWWLVTELSVKTALPSTLHIM